MRLALAIFDLDYTIWQPEMYELRGPPSLISIDEYMKTQNERTRDGMKVTVEVLQEARTKHEGKILIDGDGSIMQMFDGA